MSAVVGVAWTVYGIIAIVSDIFKITTGFINICHFKQKALGLFSVGFTQYYQSKRESERSATLVTTLLIAVSLWTVALLPIDIFLVSSTVDSETGLKKKWADGDTIYWMTLTVQTVYYILRPDVFRPYTIANAMIQWSIKIDSHLQITTIREVIPTPPSKFKLIK